MTRALLAIISMVIFASSLFAQNSLKDLMGRKVISLDIKGVSFEMQSDILKLIPLKKGDRLNAEAIKRSIKLIYKVYDIDNIEVYASHNGDGVDITFDIVPSVFIKDVQVFGNEAISSLDIIKAMDFNKMSIFSKAQETNYIEKIYQYLYSRGFRKAVVKTYTEKTEIPNILNLFVIIEENERASIGNVEIVVNDVRLKSLISNMLSLKEGYPLDIVEINNRRERLIKYFKRRGRIFVKVSEPVVKYNLQRNTGDVTIKIENERPVRVLVKGNKTMPLKTIKEKLMSIIESQEKVDVDIIKYELYELYRSYGYYFAGVNVVVERKINYDRLVIEINEKNAVLIKGFEFEGNKSYSHKVLSDVIRTHIEELFPQESIFEQIKYQEIEYGLLSSEIGDKIKYQRRISVEKDKSRLLTAEYLHTHSALENFYKSNGFLNVEVGEPQAVFNEEKDKVVLKYKINEGVQTIIRKISFENNKSLSSFILSMNARGLKNKPINYFELENAALGIRRMYENEGFFFVNVDYVVDFSDDKKNANVRFIIEENPKVFVKRIIPQGNYITNDSVILSNVFVKERGILRQNDLVSSQARLLRLSVFQDASLSVLEPEYILHEKDVLVRVRENEPRYIEYSVGLSTEEGLRTTFMFNHLNLFRSAIEFNSRLTLSYQVFMYVPGYYDESVAAAYKELVLTDAISRYINLGLNYPKIYGIPLMASTRLDVINERVNQRAYYMDRSAISPSFEVQALKYLTLYLQLSLDYKYLKRTPAVIPDSALSYSELQALRTPLGSNILGSIKPTITYDKRDDKFNPHRGYYLTFVSEYVQNLGSKPVSIVKLNSINNIYIPTSRRNTLAFQIAGGNIFSLTADSQTPSDLFFYLGGRSTLRGVAEGALWPADISDDSKVEGGEVKLSPGGNSYLLYKIEFRFPLTKGFDGGLFLDMGNLWVNTDNFSLMHLRATTGFGLRYRTPVGPIALDIGFNLMPDEAVSEPVMAWHFSVGLF
ncbi:MAG: BamA/TamA family outer membrane protein [Deltaproteobacteria bacterium]|nr:BamA/TamA family outer membrane protein [Deltaproteobacteria bacterium]